MRATGVDPIIGVPTAVPAFVGYTEKAELDGEGVFRRPIEIRSFGDFEAVFGGKVQAPEGTAPSPFHLYHSLRLFYENGGGVAFVVSAGRFAESSPVGLQDLQDALAVLEAQPGPTLLVVPDAVLLPRSDYATFLPGLLAHCGRLRDRFAIVDVPGGEAADPGEDEVRRLLEDFRNDVGNPDDDAASFGAAYFPFLCAAASSGREVVVPASGAVAGVYARTDAERGVWHAPANVSLVSVLRPTVRISDREQEDLAALPGGRRINLIREFAERDTVLWGAATLGRGDYRYVPVRRLLIYIEQSIDQGLEQAVFEPNDAPTWTAVVKNVSDFLHGLWQQGGLQGNTPEKAYHVACGLGATMTQDDIDNGRLIVQIGSSRSGWRLCGRGSIWRFTFSR